MNRLRNAIFYSDCVGLSKVDRKCYVSKTDINPATGKMYAVNPATGAWDDNYWAQNESKWNPPSSSSSTSSSSNSGFGDMTNFLQQQQAAQDKLLSDQSAKESDFLNRFNTAITGLPKASDIYSSLSDKLGITPLQTAATNLETTLSNLPDTSLQRAQRFGLNAAQMQEYQAGEASRLAPTVTAAENALGARQGQLSDLMSASLEQNNQTLLPFQTEANFISDAAARATSLYTTENQNEFQSIITKIQNNQALTLEEAKKAATLAEQEQQYNNQLDLYSKYPTLTNVPYGVSGGTGTGYQSSGSWQVVG